MERRQCGLRLRPRRQALSLRRRARAGDRDRCGDRRGEPPAAGAGAAAAAEPGSSAAGRRRRRRRRTASSRRSIAIAISGSAPSPAGTSRAITTDGSEKDRIKYGTASWVYGEELAQTSAIWWSPDSAKIAYYRFDEKQVLDYNLQLDQTKIQSTNDVEAYPKAGTSNPVVDLFVYDVATKATTRIDVRNGKPFDNDVVGHYVYRVSWSPDGRELLFNRTNRRQNILEFVAANPSTGATRVIVREEWPTGWVDNRPPMQFLKDNSRFIWESERNGFANLYLYDLAGKLIAPLTTHTAFEVTGIVKVDEAAGVLFYTARDGDNHLKLQLHRVGLDGKGDVRLTDPGVQPHGRQLHERGRRRRGAAASARRARAASRRTTSTSSTSIRPTTRRRHRASSTPGAAPSSPRSRRAT